MSIVMNMSNYEIERGSAEAEYGDEVMNPAVSLMCLHQQFVPTNKLTTLPTDLVTVNADIFIQRMCVLNV